MGRIVVLDEVTAGRIAAGEVVERPASVVKELVENSLDAGAGRVEIELEDGGRALIKVADDGEGMDAEDARLAFERHATSKLASAEDLEDIVTYGFRGEALPSIGAVARVKLLTCRPGAAEGTEIIYEGGRLVWSGPGPARPGTVVWVRDLFFNTPARREATRSSAGETARVSEAAGTLALAAPRVALTLSSDGQRLWSTPGNGRLEDAAAGLLGAAFVQNAVAVAWTSGPVKVTGLAGLPGAARRDGKRQYLFCNGRPINPRLVHAAVEEAYKTLLETGRTPVFVLNLQIPPGAVDVNIHPAKTFVRFRDHGLVHRAVLAALRAALSRGDLFAGRLGDALVAATLDRAGAGVRGVAAGFPDGTGGGAAPAAAEAAVPADWRDILDGRSRPAAGTSHGARGDGADRVNEDGATLPHSGSSQWVGDSCAGLAGLAPMGQVGGLFIVARGPDGLYVIDQHAAHERIIYERLLGEAATAAGGGRTGTEAGDTGGGGHTPAQAGPAEGVQVLAVPETLDLAPGEEEVLRSSLAFLRSVGFELEPFGGRTVIIRAVPAVLAGVSPSRLVADFLDRLGTEGGPRYREDPGGGAGAGGEGGVARTCPACGAAGFDRVRAARTMAACKAALKAGETLSLPEMRALLRDLAGTGEPRTCPHGRPTVLRIGLDELRRGFGRA